MSSIKDVTQKIVKKSYENTKSAVSEQLLFGTVMKTKDEQDKPKIQIKVQDKFELWEGASLIISSYCKGQELEEGDKVRMLSLNNGKILYVLEKGG